MAAAAVSRTQQSPIEHLDEILGRGDSCEFHTTNEIIRVARETIGISAENYLAWQDRFLSSTGYIDGIGPKDLGDKHLMWGYDRHDRIYVVFQYQIVSSEQGAPTKREISTLFQRHPRRSGTVQQTGGKDYFIYLGHVRDLPKRMDELRTLFSGKPVVKADERYDEERKLLIPFTREISLTTKETRALPTGEFGLRLVGQSVEETLAAAESNINPACLGITIIPRT